MTAGRFLLGLVRDPVSGDCSSCRTIALFLAVVCVPLAIVKGCDAGVIAALVGGGVVALLSRKSAPEQEP